MDLCAAHPDMPQCAQCGGSAPGPACEDALATTAEICLSHRMDACDAWFEMCALKPEGLAAFCGEGPPKADPPQPPRPRLLARVFPQRRALRGVRRRRGGATGRGAGVLRRHENVLPLGLRRLRALPRMGPVHCRSIRRHCRRGHGRCDPFRAPQGSAKPLRADLGANGCRAACQGAQHHLGAPPIGHGRGPAERDSHAFHHGGRPSASSRCATFSVSAVAPPFISVAPPTQGTARAAQASTVIDYALMLVAMTFNVGLFFAIAVGFVRPLPAPTQVARRTLKLA